MIAVFMVPVLILAMCLLAVSQNLSVSYKHLWYSYHFRINWACRHQI